MDVWSHLVFSRTKRYYGDNVSENGAYNFLKEAERKNSLRETRFGGTFGLMMGKRISYGIFVDLPVDYDKFVSTQIQQAGDFFKGKAKAQPAIRKPVSLWALVIMRW